MPKGLMEGFLPSDERAVSEAVYFPSMDYILYLRQDSAYVADRIDEWLTLLLDPQTGDAIGIKLKGFRNIYLRMLEVLRDSRTDLERRVPFRSFIALAETYASQLGDDIIADRERQYQYNAYEVARKIVGGMTLSADEIGFDKAA